MASNPEFDDRDRRMHADSEILIGQMTAHRDQLEAFHRDAKGRRKKEYEQQLAVADKNLFDFRSSHEVLTDNLIERGVMPESKRGRPVLENDTRTNAQKLGVPELSPGVQAVLRMANGDPNGKSLPTGAPGPAQAEPAGRHRASSQAGLGAPAGGQAKSLPSVPAPGQPGSRFQPRDVTREEQAARRDPAKGVASAPEKVSKKSLNTGAKSGLIEAIPSDVLKTGTGDKSEQGVMGAAVDGFVSGAVTGVKMNMRARAKEESSAAPGEPAGQSTTEASPSAGPVRNASGQTRQEASSPAVVEDALPGTTQPFALDVIDAVQGKSPKTVVMDPGHAAALKAMDAKEAGREEDLGIDGGRFGR